MVGDGERRFAIDPKELFQMETWRKAAGAVGSREHPEQPDEGLGLLEARWRGSRCPFSLAPKFPQERPLT